MSDSDMHHITLANGRTLAYAKYGDPDGDPTMFHHGFMCSHHQIGLADADAKKYGFSIIAPHRPGTVGSDPDPNFSPLSFAEDSLELADALGMKTFAVGGTSGGAPFALAAAVKYPERITSAIILSGMGPLGHPQAMRRLKIGRRMQHKLMKTVPILSRLYIRNAISEVTDFSSRYYEDLIHKSPPTDREILRRPDVRRALLAGFSSSTGKDKSHILKEYERYWRWGFGVEDIPENIKVFIYHGKNDKLVPAELMMHIADNLPLASIAFSDGGHFAAIGMIDIMFKDLRHHYDSMQEKA